MKNLRKLLVYILFINLFSCSKSDIILTPGVGMEGCMLGMKSGEINESIKKELGEMLVFDSNDRLMLIAGISNPAYVVKGYNVRVGDSVKIIPKEKFEKYTNKNFITSKFSFGENNIHPFGDGVMFVFDDKEIIKEIFITETTTKTE